MRIGRPPIYIDGLTGRERKRKQLMEEYKDPVEAPALPVVYKGEVELMNVGDECEKYNLFVGNCERCGCLIKWELKKTHQRWCQGRKHGD